MSSGYAKALLPRETIKRYNSRTAELLSLYLNLTPDAITPDMIREMRDACGFDNARAYAEILAAACGLDAAGRDKALFRNYFIPMVKELDPASFLSDPYYTNIKIKGDAEKSWELKMMTLAPCEAFIRDDFIVTEQGELIPQLGFFMDEFKYPAVIENGREWMTLMPNETVTTLPAVEKAHGRVLTYGLGLGYFAYMCQRKDEVSSVTVVELSEAAVSLFRRSILPQFEHPEKIELITADAIRYAEETAPSRGYDFIFADIWHDVGDGRELYRKLKSLEPLYTGVQFEYWLEKTILCYEDFSLWG